MPRLPHGRMDITPGALRNARNVAAARAADNPLAFATAKPVDLRNFDYLFPELQDDPDNLLPEARATRDSLVSLGEVMADDPGADENGDSNIPAAYTYFGQFVDHDITFDTTSATIPDLIGDDLAPLSLERIREDIKNMRTATFELDSVYGLSAPRDGAQMKLGKVTKLGGGAIPVLRPPGKADENDLPREQPSVVAANDRAARIGDPRNDENTIIAQLHVAFLHAHNKLVHQEDNNFRKAKRILRQHYQHIVIHDFLKRIAEKQVVDDVIENGNRIYDPDDEEFFMPLEFSVAAYRIGHSMVRAEYDFNLNFNTDSGFHARIFPELFTFTALSGQLGSFPTLPENWIIEWENFFEREQSFNKARRINTKLVEPLEHLQDLVGNQEQGLGAKLAVRNLLRGYLLRMPTGQAVARTLQEKLNGVREIPVLTPEQIEEGAGSEEQVQVLRDAEFLERTPLWYYILAEAAVLANGQTLGPVGSTIIAEVLVGLVRRSPNSILHQRNWKPTLPSQDQDAFTLPDLLRFAGVLAN